MCIRDRSNVVKIVVNTSMQLDAEPLILRYLWTHERTSSLWYWYLNAPWYTVNLSGSCSCLPVLYRTYGVACAVWYVARGYPCGVCYISLPYGQIRRYNQWQLSACLYDWQIRSCSVRLSQMVLPLGVSSSLVEMLVSFLCLMALALFRSLS